MGNCQAVDAAALVILRPDGKQERMYWPVAASEIMKMNPGHYVSLIIPIQGATDAGGEEKTVRFTRVKLLRPTDTLVLGRAYRLVTTQEVMKVIQAKKQAKLNKIQQQQSDQNQQTKSQKQHNRPNSESVHTKTEPQKKNTQVARTEKQQNRLGSTNLSKHRNWRPSLQSISEYSA